MTHEHNKVPGRNSVKTLWGGGGGRKSNEEKTQSLKTNKN